MIHNLPRIAWLGALAGMALLAGATTSGAIVAGAPDQAGARKAAMLITARGGICSGILVAPNVVLTAAHCVAAGKRGLRVLLGQGKAPIGVAEVSLHPEFVPDAARQRVRSIDLALVRLSGPAGSDFQPSALSTRIPGNQAEITASGFGLTSTGAAGSEGLYRSVTMRVFQPHGPSRVLVWLQPKGTSPSGVCQGDSGGPLHLGSSSAEPVFAITNWTVGACGGVAQGALIGPQKAWIDQNLARWSASAIWKH